MANRQTGLAQFFGDAVSAAGTTQLYPLGTKREEEGKSYRYVKYDNGTGNLAAVSGNVCYHTDGDWTVTMDETDADVSAVAGVFQSVPADAGYCWILTKGRVTLNTDTGDDIVEGDALSAAGDGTVTRLAYTTVDPTEAQLRAGNERVFAWALAADNDTADTVDSWVDLD